MASADVFKAGYVINDRFEITRLLGQGGFAMVFEGTDKNLGRQVAIKILHGAVLATSAEDHRVIERFEREAKLAASVDHPSVVNIYDAGEIDELGEPFIVMEYLKGDSLQDYLDDNGPLDPGRFLPLFKDVLMGLGYAHELGIVHKDLKPDNIFYRYPDSMRESLCIVDFGIAHIGRSNSGRVTRDGEFFGTPSYMPPEYISEQKVSAAFDVYQMGLILIECLSGQSVVYHEDAVATLLMHLNRQFRIPAALLESEAWPVIERAIAANPAIRYKNALGFAEALHALPSSAWPSRSELAAVAIKGEVTEKPTFIGELGDSDTESEDSELSGVWKQEDSFRTTGSNHIDTQSGQKPSIGAEPYVSVGDSGVVDTPLEIKPPSSQIDITDEISLADGSPSLTDSFVQQKSSRLGLLAAVIFVLVACASAAIALLVDPAEKEPEKTPELAVQADPPVTEEKTPEKIEVAEAPPVEKQDPPQEQPPAPEPIEVKISGTPEGALVMDRSGKIMGTAPFAMTFDSDEEHGQILVVSSEGYEEAEIQVSPALAEKGASYELVKKRRKVRPRKDTVKKEPVKQVEKAPEKKPETKVELPGTKEEKKNPGTGILLPK